MQTIESPEEIKTAVEKVLKVQEDNYGNNTPDGFKILAATCEDSVLFVGGEDGGMLTSAYAYSRDMADGYKIKPHSRLFRIYDNTVIVTGLQQSYKLLGKDTFFINVRSTKVFVRKDTSWKLAYVTNTPLPIRYNIPAVINTKKFADYVGFYQSAGAVDTVSVNDGKLIISSPGAGKTEYTPVSDSAFIGEGFFGITVFARNAAGQVTHSYYEWPDGQRISFPKIK